jgi:GT2 family glycosyltransferase
MSAAGQAFEATVVIRRFSEPDWLLLEALVALKQQEGIGLDVLVQDVRHTPEIERFTREANGALVRFRYVTFADSSLSRARNRGVAEALADIVLFSEPDALPAPDWALVMVRELRRSGAAIVGSRIVPKWRKNPPFWTRVHFVRDQYSMLDLGGDTIDVPKVFGASFGLDRSRDLADEHGEVFATGLGRRGGALFGGEETDLCARAIARGYRVAYTGKTSVLHQVMPERLTYAWIARRFYFAGRGRAQRGGKPSPSAAPVLRDYLVALPLLPWYALGVFSERLRRWRRG